MDKPDHSRPQDLAAIPPALFPPYPTVYPADNHSPFTSYGRDKPPATNEIIDTWNIDAVSESTDPGEPEMILLRPHPPMSELLGELSVRSAADPCFNHPSAALQSNEPTGAESSPETSEGVQASGKSIQPFYGEGSPPRAHGLTPVRQHKIVGPNRDIAGLKNEITRRNEQLRDTISFPTESPHEPWEQSAIEEAHRAFLAIGEELGVDVSGSLPSPRHYHFFDGRDAYHTAVSQFGGSELEMEAGGLQRPDVGILVCRRPGDFVTDRHNIAHETAHAISRQLFVPRLTSIDVADDGTEIPRINVNYRPGYQLVASGLDEMVEELWAKRVGERAWGQETFVYPIGALGMPLARETARVHEISPEEVEDNLLRGSVTGDMTGVRMLGRTLSREGMATFLQLTGQEDYDMIRHAAMRLKFRDNRPG